MQNKRTCSSSPGQNLIKNVTRVSTGSFLTENILENGSIVGRYLLILFQSLLFTFQFLIGLQIIGIWLIIYNIHIDCSCIVNKELD